MSARTGARRVIGAFALAACIGVLVTPPANARVAPTPANVATTGGSATVTVTDTRITGGSSGSGNTGGTGSGNVAEALPSVPAPCWMSPTMSGKAYFEYVQFTGASQAFAGYLLHKDDDKGQWYSPECNRSFWPNQNDMAGYDAFLTQFWIDNPPTWVSANQVAPTPRVRPEVLREIAIKRLTPPPPELNWNPKRSGNAGTLVNLETWFWLGNSTSPITVSVTAGGSQASVTATFGGMKISAPGETPVSCDGPGTPYTPGARTTCSLAFSRASSALGTQTTPVTVTTTWTGTWTSGGVDMGSIPPLDPVTGQVPIQVDEVQTLVTGAR